MCVPEQRADRLEIVMLLQDLHCHAVPEVVRLQLVVTDHPAVHLAEPPDVLVGHRRCVLPTPRRPQLDQNSGVSGSILSTSAPRGLANMAGSRASWPPHGE